MQPLVFIVSKDSKIPKIWKKIDFFLQILSFFGASLSLELIYVEYTIFWLRLVLNLVTPWLLNHPQILSVAKSPLFQGYFRY